MHWDLKFQSLLWHGDTVASGKHGYRSRKPDDLHLKPHRPSIEWPGNGGRAWVPKVRLQWLTSSTKATPPKPPCEHHQLKKPKKRPVQSTTLWRTSRFGDLQRFFFSTRGLFMGSRNQDTDIHRPRFLEPPFNLPFDPQHHLLLIHLPISRSLFSVHQVWVPVDKDKVPGSTRWNSNIRHTSRSRWPCWQTLPARVGAASSPQKGKNYKAPVQAHIWIKPANL